MSNIRKKFNSLLKIFAPVSSSLKSRFLFAENSNLDGNNKPNSSNSDGGNNLKNDKSDKNDNNLNRKLIINLLVFFGTILVIGLVMGLGGRIEEQTKPKTSFSDLLTEIRKGGVSEVELSESKDKLLAKLYEPLTDQQKEEIKNSPDKAALPEFAEKSRQRTRPVIYPNITSGTGSTLEKLQNSLEGDNVKFGTGSGEVIYTEKPKAWYVEFVENSLFQTLLLLGGTVLLGMFLIRRLGDVNNRSISFGNSRGKVYDELQTEKITFADVAGNEEAKQELFEVVDFLKRPEEYTKMGAKIPKGVLLVGLPGNGKTLMAKAIAGEAGVPFIYVSGSEFVEMFVGVGASRVRDLFKQARKKSPCVIFIDEIDAVGRQRGAGLGGGNDEREQTLNQILVELDGFDATTYVVLIGATNRPDVLDPALLRPGRFDRQVTVTSPDRKEREAILKIHARNKKFEEDVDLSIVAKRTAGFSGADLMNVLNEAAILAVRDHKTSISKENTLEAIEKVLLGPSLKSKVITESQKKLTAYHEAGHALIQSILPECRKVQKVTIIPRGRAAGYTFADEGGDADAITRKRSEFMADITALFGGYVAEETIFGEVSTGASNDLQKATEIARNMVTKYGMSALGPISFDEGKGLSFLGKDMVEKQNYSEDSAKRIDMEVSSILKNSYQNCQGIVHKYVEDLHNIAKALIEREVIEYEEFNQLVQHLLPVKKEA